jgi:hypothetical protein
MKKVDRMRKENERQSVTEREKPGRKKEKKRRKGQRKYI